MVNKFKKGDIAYIKIGKKPIGWDSHKVKILERVIVKKGTLRRVAYKIKYLDTNVDSVARPIELYSHEQFIKSVREVGDMFSTARDLVYHSTLKEYDISKKDFDSSKRIVKSNGVFGKVIGKKDKSGFYLLAFEDGGVITTKDLKGMIVK